MYHDFADRHGGEGNPCDDTGIMSYGSYSWWETISQWSTCSASDFASHYDAYNWGKWCLDDISGKIIEPHTSSMNIDLIYRYKMNFH